MNFTDGNIFFLADFDDNMEREVTVPLIREIQKQRTLKDGRIDLYINSFGGYAHLVFKLVVLVEEAKKNGITVRTIVPSVAYSAGSILAVTGSPGERYIDKDGEHLIHYGTTGSFESTPEQVERTYIHKTNNFRRIKRHYARYSNDKFPAEELDKLMNDDSGYIPAAKCVKWGLADRYMKDFDIGYE
jgi:ATP-dependent protease ClpP protease subunit